MIMDALRKKLIFRAWHRGTREMDIIMGRFAESHVPSFDDARLRQFEELLGENDPDLYDWLVGKETAPERCDHAVMQALRDFHLNKKN